MPKTWGSYHLKSVARRGNRDAVGLIKRMSCLAAWRSSTRHNYLQADPENDLRNCYFVNATFFGRNGQMLDKFLLTHILPSLAKTKHETQVRVLDVGIGHSITPTEPLELYALLKNGAFEPRITVMDCNESSLKQLLAASQVVFPEKIPFKNTILLSEHYEYARRISAGLGAQMQGKETCFSFPVPSGLTSSFDLRNADVVLWEPGSTDLGKFTLAVAINVTQYLDNSPDSIALVFLNMLDSVEKGGFIIISGHYGSTYFIDSPKMQTKFGYTVIGNYCVSDFYTSLIQKD